MTKTLLLFGFLLFLNCYKIERNCNAFKVGAFKAETIINNVSYKSTFTRTKDLQIEIYNDVVDSSYVRWINDCEVIFKTVNPKNRIEKKDLHLKILTTTDSSYTYEYAYVGETKKKKGTAYRVKKN